MTRSPRQSILETPDSCTLSEEVRQQHMVLVLHQLLPGVLHELNNPISQVLSDLQTLEEYTSFLREGASLLYQFDPQVSPTSTWVEAWQRWRTLENVPLLLDDLQQLLLDISSGLGRIPGISKSLQFYLKSSPSEATPVDVNDVLDNALGLVYNRLKYHAQLQLSQGKLKPVLGSSASLCHALVNVLLNAAIAIGDKGVVSLATEQKEASVLILVQDDGCGMTAEEQSDALKPFVSHWNPPQPHAKGLGLCLASQIVAEHYGALTLESQAGAGTSVKIELPCR